MKTLKTLLRYWIALISLLGFLGGWITLAHAQKPVQPGNSSTFGALNGPGVAPLQPLNLNGDASNGANNNNFSFQPSAPQPEPESRLVPSPVSYPEIALNNSSPRLSGFVNSGVSAPNPCSILFSVCSATP